MSRDGAASSRVIFLDGLRGIAAFVVIVSHLIAGFFPALYFGAQGRPGAELMGAIATSPLFVAYSGTFAVYIFFVLSGFVIAASAARTACRLPVLVAARYLRLAVPVGASVFFAFALVNIFPGAPQRAAAVVGNWWLDLIYRPFNLTFGFALREAFVKVYWTGVSYYNNVLWTMRIELAGSVAIYLFYRLIPKGVRVPALVLAGLLACFATRAWPSDLLGFFFGALIYEARARGKLFRAPLLGAGLVVVGMYLGGLPFAPGDGTFYQALFAFVDRLSPAFGTVRVLGAAALILGIFLWEGSRLLLDSPPAQFLGRISFALYLVHLPLLCVGFSELYLRFGQFGAAPMGLAIACYLAAAIGAAYLFTILVDEPTVGMLSRWKKARSARRAAAPSPSPADRRPGGN
jgi:peptidoglycan/LPS O-acetylase OafA/YrhL